MPPKQPRSAHGWRAAAVYAAMIAASVGIFFIIQMVGERLDRPTDQALATTAENSAAPPAAATAGKALPKVNVVAHVLATLTAVIVLGTLLGYLLRFVGQPPVIGEVIAGILLGPSVLGAISPEAMHWLIPSSQDDPNRLVLTAVRAIAQLGVVLYMFVIGLELNAAKLRSQAGALVAISQASIVAPFLLGAALTLWLYSPLAPAGVPFTNFALFMGVAMSITAFPVLARILSDRGLSTTSLGVLALGCAAAGDLTAWCLLALMAGVVRAQLDGLLSIVGWAAVYLAVMLLVVRPLAVRWSRLHDGRSLPAAATAALIAAMLLSALTTEWIGIHAVFGAFLLGVVIPDDSQIAQTARRQLRDVATILLLPAFFAINGMNTEIGLISGWQNWTICLVIILVATFGKFGGTLVAARLTKQTWRDAAALGTLMNTRGLMELIVLDVGLSLGVISPTLFSMMVLMALATTIVAAPVLSWLLREAKVAEEKPAVLPVG